jgi:hypothetical protein
MANEEPEKYLKNLEEPSSKKCLESPRRGRVKKVERNLQKYIDYLTLD